MRKLLLSTLFFAAIATANAQNLDDVQKKISEGKWEEAKTSIDKILADSKNQSKANPWYYKGTIYTELARLDTAGVYPQTLAKEGFDALKKYQELDPKNTMMLLDQSMGYLRLWDLYYNRGIKNYNKKDYVGAYNDFRDALAVEDYILKKSITYSNITFHPLDTALVNLTAQAAYLAKKEDEAIPYYEKIANAKVTGDDYKFAYSILAEYFLKKNDPKGDQYLQLGKQLYPDETYWISFEFNLVDVGDDKDKMRARYEEMLKKYPNSPLLTLDYAVELFNHTYSYDKKPADYTARQETLRKALDRAVEVQPNSTLANYVLSQHIYNEIYDLEEALRAVKGTTPADQAKKKDLNAKIDKKFEELYTYSQKAYDLYSAEASLKAQDKANYRKVINQLIDYYQKKKQTDKATALQAKLKTL
jgi:hypothetical protein